MSNPLMDQLIAGAKQQSLHSAAKVAPTLSVKDGVGVLSFEAITLTTFNAAKEMPDRHRWDGRDLRFVPTEANLKFIRRQWPGVIVLRDAIPSAAFREPMPQPAPVQGQMSWTPRLKRFEHQQRGFDLAAGAAEFAYLWDMGTGKTKAGIDDAAFSFARGDIDRVLVVAPAGVHEQWIDDALPVHWPIELACRRDALITGKRKPDWWGDNRADPDDCKWLAVNFEAIKAKRSGRTWTLEPLAEELVEWMAAGKCMLIVDESHKAKNPQGVRANALAIMARHAVQRRIMTGSPIARGIEDYYAQFRILNPEIIGCRSFSGFKQQFCITGGFDGRQIVGYRSTDEFHRRIAPYSMRADKADVLDLPPKLYSILRCDMTPEQRRVYGELKNELITQLTDGTLIEAGQVVQRLLRLQQVTQGFLPREDGGFDEFPENKTALLMDLLEQAPDRAVIWCRFTRDIERLAGLLGNEAVMYYGGNKSDRPEIKAQWLSASAGKRWFVGNPQAGGTGLDWLMKNGPVSTVAYYSNSFSSIDRWQSEDRTYRIGLKGTVNYYDLVCRGTNDPMLLANLKGKRSLADMSFAELKEFALRL